MNQHVTRYFCPECGSDAVYISLLPTMEEPDSWYARCMACKHSEGIAAFAVRMDKRPVTSNIISKLETEAIASLIAYKNTKNSKKKNKN